MWSRGQLVEPARRLRQGHFHRRQAQDCRSVPARGAPQLQAAEKTVGDPHSCVEKTTQNPPLQIKENVIFVYPFARAPRGNRESCAAHATETRHVVRDTSSSERIRCFSTCCLLHCACLCIRTRVTSTFVTNTAPVSAVTEHLDTTPAPAPHHDEIVGGPCVTDHWKNRGSDSACASPVAPATTDTAPAPVIANVTPASGVTVPAAGYVPLAPAVTFTAPVSDCVPAPAPRVQRLLDLWAQERGAGGE